MTPARFQHVLDIVGTATLLLGIAKLVETSKPPGLEDYARMADDAIDDAARAGAGTLDDMLDDIAGLTAEQIQSKFSLPQTPTYIADVLVPAGTKIEVSIANGILGGSGGGVQYRLIGEYFKEWFVNERAIQ